jgi:uncharacterized membrane protein
MTSPPPRLTPQERVILAKQLNKKAKNQKFTPQQRKEARRHASNMLALNLMEAKRKKSD